MAHREASGAAGGRVIAHFEHAALPSLSIRGRGGRTYVVAWQDFITQMNTALADAGLALLPNTGSFTTSWDTTNYALTAGVFIEGFADKSWAVADWKRSTNQAEEQSAKRSSSVTPKAVRDPSCSATSGCVSRVGRRKAASARSSLRS